MRRLANAAFGKYGWQIVLTTAYTRLQRPGAAGWRPAAIKLPAAKASGAEGERARVESSMRFAEGRRLASIRYYLNAAVHLWRR